MWTWIKHHPELVWPIVTAIVTALMRKRTAAEYAAMPPRLAAFMRLVGAAGFNLPKVIETIGLLITGNVPDDSPLRSEAIAKAFGSVDISAKGLPKEEEEETKS